MRKKPFSVSVSRSTADALLRVCSWALANCSDYFSGAFVIDMDCVEAFALCHYLLSVLPAPFCALYIFIETVLFIF